jgi:chitin disaccharide deacetylase
MFIFGQIRKPNPVLKKLGLQNDDRVVIIHVDDVGMCQAGVEAFADLWECGIISSGSTMVPCPWFLASADLCRARPDIDMGVHMTLTSEWKTYRWGPISSRDPKTGLIDEQGYFYHTAEEAQENANPGAAQVEMEAQLGRAIIAGIVPTHMDTHMGTVAHFNLLGHYLQLALAHHLPPMMMRLDTADLERRGVDPENAQTIAKMLLQVEEQGLPLLDQIATVHLDDHEDRFERTLKVLSDLPAGITHFYIHPAKDTPELRAITPDWRCRIGDYENFMSEDMRRFLKNSGLHVIGYQALKDLIS